MADTWQWNVFDNEYDERAFTVGAWQMLALRHMVFLWRYGDLLGWAREFPRP